MSRTAGRAYLILSLERTGSGLLCDALRRTGVLGTPSELFGAGIHHRAAELGVDAHDSFSAYVEAVARRTMSGGVFGVKIHRNQYLELEQMGRVTTPLELVPENCRATVRVVLLSREDRARQAISVLLARATGVWARFGDTEIPSTTAPNPYWASRLNQAPENLRATLDEIVETTADEERGWLRWLEAANLEPLRISYENLCDDYGRTVSRVAQHVGDIALDPSDVPPARFRKQGDERTERLLRAWTRDGRGSLRINSPAHHRR